MSNILNTGPFAINIGPYNIWAYVQENNNSSIIYLLFSKPKRSPPIFAREISLTISSSSSDALTLEPLDNNKFLVEVGNGDRRTASTAFLVKGDPALLLPEAKVSCVYGTKEITFGRLDSDE